MSLGAKATVDAQHVRGAAGLRGAVDGIRGAERAACKPSQQVRGRHISRCSTATG